MLLLLRMILERGVGMAESRAMDSELRKANEKGKDVAAHNGQGFPARTCGAASFWPGTQEMWFNPNSAIDRFWHIPFPPCNSAFPPTLDLLRP